MTLAVIMFLVGSTCAQWPPAPPLKADNVDDPGPLPASITAEPMGAGSWRCTFRFRPPEGAQRVALAGTFNGWNRDANPMTGPDEQGEWKTTIQIASAAHQYKFVVDGARWFSDPENSARVDDNRGGFNSVLYLGRMARLTESPGRVGDGRIDAAGLEHQSDLPLYFQALSANRALLRYRTFAHDVQHVWAAVRDGDVAEMRQVDSGPLFALWEATVSVTDVSVGRPVVEYTFVLSDGGPRFSDANVYAVGFSEEDIFRTPDWAKNAAWYQIMLDRFRNGDPGNDPEPVRPWTSEWFTPSPWEGADGETFYKHFVFRRFYGGDLAGLEEELPYLHELGVNAIYLNPIFKAPSNHKYNATNYLHVDDHFGTKGDYAAAAEQEDLLDPSTWVWTESDRRFIAFLKEAHDLGFRVIIDGVFNHVGTEHPAFQDVQKNGKRSRFADWFDVTSWEPFRYNGWAGFGELPVFKKSPDGLASPSLKAHLFAVTRRWMDPDGDGDPSDGIDGWRLDVPNEIAEPFWVEWREVVKSVNPDAYITGEIWDRADAWLDGRHFDAVMNYEFARAAVAWICNKRDKITVSEIDRRLRKLRLAYPLAATLVMQNLVDSHDTDRLASMALNPDRTYDHENRVQDNGPNYNNDKPSADDYTRARLVALLQMTYVGAPMIYYGDEVGMWGADDPTCRKPMLWEDLQPYEKPEENFVMKDHLDFYKQVVALRNAHPALRTGSFQTLLADDEADVWVFRRWNRDEQLVVALNASERSREVVVALLARSPSLWSGVFGAEGMHEAQDDRLKLRVPAVGGLVLSAPAPK